MCVVSLLLFTLGSMYTYNTIGETLIEAAALTIPILITTFKPLLLVSTLSCRFVIVLVDIMLPSSLREWQQGCREGVSGVLGNPL